MHVNSVVKDSKSVIGGSVNRLHHFQDNHILNNFQNTEASIYLEDERLTGRSREISKSRDSGLNFSSRSEIWQEPR